MNYLARSGKIIALKLGGQWYTTRAAVSAYQAGQPQPENPTGFMSLAQAAKQYGYSAGHLNLLAREGKLEAVKLGRNWYTTERAIDQYRQGVREIELVPDSPDPALQISQPENINVKVRPVASYQGFGITETDDDAPGPTGGFRLKSVMVSRGFKLGLITLIVSGLAFGLGRLVQGWRTGELNGLGPSGIAAYLFGGELAQGDRLGSGFLGSITRERAQSDTPGVRPEASPSPDTVVNNTTVNNYNQTVNNDNRQVTNISTTKTAKDIVGELSDPQVSDDITINSSKAGSFSPSGNTTALTVKQSSASPSETPIVKIQNASGANLVTVDFEGNLGLAGGSRLEIGGQQIGIANLADGSSIASLSGSQTLTNKTLSAGVIYQGSAISPSYGGTGLTSAPSNGQLLIGNGSGYTLAALTAGTAINVTNGSGSITIANSGVTSLSAGTGIAVSGSSGAVTLTNSGVTALTGTTNQVSLSGSTGSITISTPQNIHTGASPTFSRLNLSEASNQLVLQSNSVTGSLTWTPVTSNKTITLPNLTGTAFLIDGGQTISSAVWNASAIGPSYGGTGQTTLAKGDILYGSATDIWSRLAVGSIGYVLQVSLDGVPEWATISSLSVGNADTLDSLDSADFLRATASDTFEGVNSRTLTIQSDLSSGARTVDLLTISQANDPTNNFTTGNLLTIAQLDTGSSADALELNQTGSGKAINIVSGELATAGNIVQTGATTLSTGTGAVSLGGDTTIATGKNLTLASGTGTFSQIFSNTTGTGANWNITNSGSSGTNTVGGIGLVLAGTANTTGSNVINAINFSNVPPATNNSYYALNVGTGFTDIVRYNGAQLISGSGVIQSAALSGNYTGVTGVGILSTGTWNADTIIFAKGGTGLTATPSNGQLLIGNGSGYTLAGLTGTTNQINVASGAGSITLSTPQNIHTAASPTFAGLTLSDLTPGSLVFAGAGGVISQDNAKFFWDQTNTRLGLGTSSPLFPIHVVRSGGGGTLNFDTYAGSGLGNSAIQGRRAAGTLASPTATLSDMTLFDLLGSGYDGSAFTGQIASIRMQANQNFSPTSQGTRIVFLTTANDSTTATERLRIKHNGDVAIGNGSTDQILFGSTGSAVFNEQGNDADFRVEGDTDANLLFTDASADVLGVGTATFEANTRKMEVRYTDTATSGGTFSTIRLLSDINAPSNSTASHFGLGTTLRTASGNASNYTDSTTGIKAMNFVVQHRGTGTVTRMTGLGGNVTNSSSGTITTAESIVAGVDLTSTGPITTWNALRVFAPSITGSGVLTNARGLYISNITGASTQNLAILTEGGGVVFNENGTDSDFRVEGDTDANLLFTDASADRVGIGTNTPSLKLHVVDNSSTSAIFQRNSTATGSSVGSTVFLDNLDTTTNNGARLIFRTNDTGGATRQAAGIGSLVTARGASSVTGDLVFLTNNNSTGVSEVARLTGAGALGIGESPAANMKLDVAGRVQINLAGTQTSVALCGSHPAGGGASVSDVEIVDCTGTPAADYAEIYPVSNDVEYTDLVAIGPDSVKTTDQNSIQRLVKATIANQANTLGVVVDNYGDFSSVGHNIKGSDNPKPVALSGRVRVKVSGQSGAIAPGDYLTASSKPGRAMKATSSAKIVGVALGSFSGDEGTVMMFVSNFWYNPSSGESIQGTQTASYQALEVAGLLRTNLLEVAGPAEFKGSLVVWGETTFKAPVVVQKTLTAKEKIVSKGDLELKGNLVLNPDIKGSALPVTKGATSLEVVFSKPQADTSYLAFVTPSQPIGFGVTKQSDKMIVTFEAEAPEGLILDWLIVR